MDLVAQDITPIKFQVAVDKGTFKILDENEKLNTPSYLFNGAVNTTAQGHPVPIGYGRLIVGSAVISASIVTTEYT